jgi:membrane protease subunit HflK
MDNQGPPNTETGRSRNWRPIAIITLTLFMAAVAVLMAGAVVVLTGFYTVQPEEVAVVLRFGEHIRTTEPGLNFKLPAPIEQVFKVPIQRQLKQEFGFHTPQTGDPAPDPGREVDHESMMITGDLNLAEVEWITQYRIQDPVKYLFGVRDVTSTFRNLNEAIMRAVVGDRSIDEVITIGRLEIEDEVKARLQEVCDRLGTGIVVDQVVLHDVNPPEEVKPSFDEVNKAENDRERAIRRARTASQPQSAGGGS